MTQEQIIIVVLGVLAGVLLILAVVLAAKYAALRRRTADPSRAEQVVVKDGVRYSRDTSVRQAGEAKVSHAEGDFVLAAGKTYRAQQGGALLPGTYTALASSDAAHTFKLRVGGLVRTYSHGDVIVLKDGEEICAVACAVILR